MRSLGIDTSNYTTSVAVVEDGAVRQYRRLLPVPEGTRGLRQSEAVFLHTAALPELLEQAFSEFGAPDRIGVSLKPRPVEGSYMPAFTVGSGFARALAAATGAELRPTTHQEGHIAAVLFEAEKMELLAAPFYALHLSGGTTELVYCRGRKSVIVGRTLDISAGQLIDRLGVFCGLQFPCGAALERLAPERGTVPPLCAAKGCDCNFSGLENRSKKLIEDGADAGSAARFLFDSIERTLVKMIETAMARCGEAPLVLCGGVMSNRSIREGLSRQFETVSASPAVSADNAVGVAALALLEEVR